MKKICSRMLIESVPAISTAQSKTITQSQQSQQSQQKQQAQLEQIKSFPKEETTRLKYQSVGPMRSTKSVGPTESIGSIGYIDINLMKDISLITQIKTDENK